MAVEEQPDIYERVRAARDFAYEQASKYLTASDGPDTDKTGMARFLDGMSLHTYRSIVETLNVVLGEPPATDLRRERPDADDD